MPGEWWRPLHSLVQLRVCYLVRWVDTDTSQGLSCIFVSGKQGNCLTFLHLASELDGMACLLDAMSLGRSSFFEVSLSLQEHQEHPCVEAPCIYALKELSHGQCWDILQCWHADRVTRFWTRFEQDFKQIFPSVFLPCEMWRVYIEAEVTLDSNLRVRVLRRGMDKSYEEREQMQEWLCSPPSIDRSRHIWLTQVLVQFYLSLPLERIDMTGPRVSKAASGGIRGLDYFVHLYLKKFDKRVPVEVRVQDLEPLQIEMVLTQQCLCHWWREKLQNGLQDWPGFRMDAEHIYVLTVRAVLYANLQMGTWREMNVFVAAVSAC